MPDDAAPHLQGNDAAPYADDEHWIPEGEEGQHETSSQCGCNPDWHSAQDPQDESGWVHWRFGEETTG